LSDPGLRRALSRSLEKRVPAGEIDDLVQATLLDALSAPNPPADAVELRRWVYGILHNKVADHYRARSREVPLSLDVIESPAESAPTSARDLLRWAERELPPGEDAARTLEWMLDEGDGEKLENIARAERMPAPRVRQRIARLRKHFRGRWAAQVAAIIAAVAAVVGIGLLARRYLTPVSPVVLVPEPSSRPDLRAVELRRFALEKCERAEYEECLRGLDEAKRLDPSGDRAAAIQEVRRVAAEALAPKRPPTDKDGRILPGPSPSSTPAPRLRPTPSSIPAPRPRPTSAPSPTTAPPHKATHESAFSSESAGSK
jgi:DNA-directed RNA polymerase specialized sigma24 family protein